MTTDNTTQETTGRAESAKALDDLIASFEQIKTLYGIENSLEVFQMMLEQESIAPLVLEAYPHIRALFPAEKLELEVKNEPDAAYCRSLWIGIYTTLEAEEAFLKLKQLDHNWWLDAKTAAPRNDLHISLEWA